VADAAASRDRAAVSGTAIDVGLRAGDLMRRFWADYAAAKEYAGTMEERWAPRWAEEDDGDWLPDQRTAGSDSRIGYVIGTFSPVTHAHLDLARNAADELGLARVTFVTYPFRHIPDFHTEPLDEWVSRLRHIGWEERIELMQRAVEDTRDGRLHVLVESKPWYEESIPNWRAGDRLSTFWTGTWYLMRKLQWLIRDRLGDNVGFVFACGADQFNANVDALLYAEGLSDAFRDYSIAEHLAIHDVYAAPREGDEGDALEEFIAPFGCEHSVIVGAPLPNTLFSATQVRFQRLEEGRRLEDYVTPGVAARIREKKLWGYGE
jgi:nicotinic acid mononucleotide adenylyltransferase